MSINKHVDAYEFERDRTRCKLATNKDKMQEVENELIEHIKIATKKITAIKKSCGIITQGEVK